MRIDEKLEKKVCLSVLRVLSEQSERAVRILS